MHAILKKLADNQIVIALLVVLGLWVLYEIRILAAVLFLSFIIMSGFLPIVEFFTRRGMPHIMAVIVPYLAITAVMLGIVIPLIPVFSIQISTLGAALPAYVNALGNFINGSFEGLHIGTILKSNLQQIIDAASAQLVMLTGQVIGAILSFGTAVVLSFYMLLDHDRFKRSLARMLSIAKLTEMENLIADSERQMGHWINAQIILSVIVGIMVWISMWIAGVPFAPVLGLIAALFEFIPYIGPIIAAIPALLIALNQSPALALATAGIFIGIQLIENNILVPQIMRRSIKLHPILAIAGFAAGGALAGFMGAIFAIPFMAFLIVCGKHARKLTP